MTKIAFIGAGSLGFTADLVRDILTFPFLQDSTLALMDINPERLDFAKTGVSKIIAEGKYPAKVTATLDRAEALKDADVVLTTILAGIFQGGGLNLQQAWSATGAVFGLIAVISTLLTALTVKERPELAGAPSTLPPIKAVTIPFKNRPFIILMLAFIFSSFSFSDRSALSTSSTSLLIPNSCRISFHMTGLVTPIYLSRYSAETSMPSRLSMARSVSRCSGSLSIKTPSISKITASMPSPPRRAQR